MTAVLADLHRHRVGGDEREQKFPRHAEADGWSDAFRDRFGADAITGAVP